MSDKIKGLTVVLAQDYRDEDVQKIIDTIEMIKGVKSVTMIEVNANDYINRERIKSELREKIIDVLYD